MRLILDVKIFVQIGKPKNLFDVSDSKVEERAGRGEGNEALVSILMSEKVYDDTVKKVNSMTREGKIRELIRKDEIEPISQLAEVIRSLLIRNKQVGSRFDWDELREELLSVSHSFSTLFMIHNLSFTPFNHPSFCFFHHFLNSSTRERHHYSWCCCRTPLMKPLHLTPAEAYLDRPNNHLTLFKPIKLPVFSNKIYARMIFCLRIRAGFQS